MVGESPASSLSQEEITRKADEALTKRARGRLVGGDIIPDEKRLQGLEEREKGGHISPNEQAELDGLRFKLKGSKVDRWARGEK